MNREDALRTFLEYVVGILVKHPGDVGIEHEFADNRHVFHLKLNPADIGQLIGKNGYTISAIRSLLNAAAERDGTKAVLKVREEE
jgi:hypothetical protein